MSDAQRSSSPLPAWVRKQGTKQQPDYEQEHMALYEEAGMPWPPKLEDVVRECGVDMAYLTPRCRELAYYCNRRWPLPQGIDCQFIDVNLSTERLMRAGKCAWYNDAMFTIIGSSQIVLRRRVSGASDPEVRLLRGAELMCLQGWTGADYSAGLFTTTASNDTLTSLAGNAFSAFAVGAIMHACLPKTA